MIKCLIQQRKVAQEWNRLDLNDTFLHCATNIFKVQFFWNGDFHQSLHVQYAPVSKNAALDSHTIAWYRGCGELLMIILVNKSS